MSGFRIGAIFGIDIRVDYSWFVIFFLILWTLTNGVFPAELPGQAPLTYLAMGGAGTLLFFASLLAHELAHSLLARSRGIAVHSITLFIFGGMARTTQEFENPRDEFVIAGIGPVSSIAIAALFWLAARAAALFALPDAVSVVAAYLAVINLVLAIFNLFPGFPLDGGRLFRAIVWKRTGDLRRATRAATNGGKVFGYLLMALGLLDLFTGRVAGGLWLLFIGWFVRTTAEASYTQYVLRTALAHVRAQDLMTPHPRTVHPDVTLRQFLDEFVLDSRHHSYPVVDDGTPLGIITLERVRLVPRGEWATRTVRDAMLPASADSTVQPEQSMSDALDKLGRSELRRLLVVHDGRLVGIIAQADVARWLDHERLRQQLAAPH